MPETTETQSNLVIVHTGSVLCRTIFHGVCRNGLPFILAPVLSCLSEIRSHDSFKQFESIINCFANPNPYLFNFLKSKLGDRFLREAIKILLVILPFLLVTVSIHRRYSKPCCTGGTLMLACYISSATYRVSPYLESGCLMQVEVLLRNCSKIKALKN